MLSHYRLENMYQYWAAHAWVVRSENAFWALTTLSQGY